jgi:hypothetical protein
MIFKVQCKQCGCSFWVRGSYESDTNATELNDNDRHWDDACEHIKETGDYDITDSEYEAPLEDDYL